MKGILQGFKRRILQMQGKVAKDRAYLCDPKWNSKCRKESCWEINQGRCKCTEKKKYAKRDADGKPIIAKDQDLYNEEWMDLMVSTQLAEERADIYGEAVH